MTPQRRDQLLTGVSSTARKMYDFVPIAESWPMHKIEAEAGRQGTILGRESVMRCIMILVDTGLVRMDGDKANRVFCRVRVTEMKVAQKKEEAMPKNEPKAAPPKEKQSATALFAGVAKRARDVASQLSNLADEIEIVAMEVDENSNHDLAEFEKLRQMQALLKSVVGG